jgi:hypothetical protein
MKIFIKCQTPDCAGSIVLDRDQFDNECLKCYLCERPLMREDFRHLITERNNRGFNNFARPIKRGKRQYGNRIKERV